MEKSVEHEMEARSMYKADNMITIVGCPKYGPFLGHVFDGALIFWVFN